MVKCSFSDKRTVYRSFLSINLSVSVSYAVDKLHVHTAPCKEYVQHTCLLIPNTEDNLAKQRDLDPCLREHQRANNQTFAFCFKPFLQ